RRSHAHFPYTTLFRSVWSPFMSNGKRKLRLVKAQPCMSKSTKQFRCGDKILESGIYRVYHRNHRLAHAVNAAFQYFVAAAKLLRDRKSTRLNSSHDQI